LFLKSFLKSFCFLSRPLSLSSLSRRRSREAPITGAYLAREKKQVFDLSFVFLLLRPRKLGRVVDSFFSAKGRGVPPRKEQEEQEEQRRAKGATRIAAGRRLLSPSPVARPCRAPPSRAPTIPLDTAGASPDDRPVSARLDPGPTGYAGGGTWDPDARRIQASPGCVLVSGSAAPANRETRRRRRPSVTHASRQSAAPGRDPRLEVGVDRTKGRRGALTTGADADEKNKEISSVVVALA
jgi:hypothetical protein